MLFIAELLYSLTRVTVLFWGIILTYILGASFYKAINQFLSANSYPCIELISTIVIFVPPLALIFGIHLKKFSWQRIFRYNGLVFLSAFLLGILLTQFPPEFLNERVPLPYCTLPGNIHGQITYILGTGFVTSLFAFIGLDLGVLLKHVSLKIQHKPQEKKKKKR